MRINLRLPALPPLLACVCLLATALPCAAQTPVLQPPKQAAQQPVIDDEERPETPATLASGFWAEFKQVWNNGQRQRLRIEYENDLFYNTDRNYTDGVRFTLKRASDHPSKFSGEENPRVPPLRFRVARNEAELAKMRAQDEADCAGAARSEDEYRLGLREAQAKDPGATESLRPYCYKSGYSVVAFGHNMYTPADITLPTARVPAKDRPYAAWAYFGIHREIYSSDDRYWRYGIDIGCVGPCAYGRQLQTWFHKNITDSPLPNGWDAQIRNEFGAVLRFEHAWRSWRVGPRRETQNRPASVGEGFFGTPLALDVRPSVNFGVGNIMTYAGLGLTGRIGWFRSGYESLRLDTHAIESLAHDTNHAPANPGYRLPRIYAQAPMATQNDASPALAPADRVPDKAAAPDRSATPATKLVPEVFPELFAFGRVHSDLVAYNALLQGGLFNRSSPKTAPARPLIVERELGVMGAYGEFSLSLSLVSRWEWQMDGTRFGQRFGRIAVEFNTRF